MIRTTFATVAALALAGCVAAPPPQGPSPTRAAQSDQLAASVQRRLNLLGFRDVDARTLSTRQLAALHTKLQGPIFGGIGLDNRFINLRSEVRVILGWEDEGRPSR